MPVVCNPIPPFFLARPCRTIRLPIALPLPQISHTRAMHAPPRGKSPLRLHSEHSTLFFFFFPRPTPCRAIIKQTLNFPDRQCTPGLLISCIISRTLRADQAGCCPCRQTLLLGTEELISIGTCRRASSSISCADSPRQPSPIPSKPHQR